MPNEMNEDDLAEMDRYLAGVGGEVEEAYRAGWDRARASQSARGAELVAEQARTIASLKANRWAAFTDDELHEIHDHLVSGLYSPTDPGAPHMLGEILDELERRRREAAS